MSSLVGQAVPPASTFMTAPVMLRAFSLIRKSTMFATSLTSAIRRSEFRRSILARASPYRLSVMSVAMKPGATAFTVMPAAPTSRARDPVNPLRAALLAL